MPELHFIFYRGEFCEGCFMRETEYLVLRTEDGRFFCDWQQNKTKPIVKLCTPLVCARPFTNDLLAKSFQSFLENNGIKTKLFIVQGTRLLREWTRDRGPKPIKRPRPRIEYLRGQRD